MRLLSRAATLWAIAGALVAVCAVRPFIQRRVRHRPWFNYSCSPLGERELDRLATRPRWSRNSLRVADSVVLNGLIRRPEKHQAPWLLFFPGNDAHQLAVGQDFLERVCAGHDWGLAVFAYRGYDSSGGSPSPQALSSDGVRILDYLIQHERLAPMQVHVAGFSLGTYVAAHVVGQAALSNGRLASLTMLSSISEIEMVRSPLIARVAIGDIYRTLALLDSIPAPVLIIHGNADRAVDIRQGRQNAARLAGRARFLEIPGAGHALNENDGAIDAVREMVESNSKTTPN